MQPQDHTPRPDGPSEREGGLPLASETISRRHVLGLAAGAIASTVFGLGSAEHAEAAPASYKIVFHLNGGKNPVGQIKRVPRGMKLKTAKLKTPKRSGYKFKGWYSNKKLSKKASGVRGLKNTARRTVYAKWALRKYKISYALNGGTAALPLASSYSVKSPAIALPRPVRDGYHFVGWYADSKLKTAKAKVAKGSTGNKKFYAKWKSASYWDWHLDMKVSHVNAHVPQASDGNDTFVFLTDVHLPSNAIYSPYLAKQVVARTPADMVVFGGDAINYSADKAEAVDIVKYMCKAFDFAEFHFVRGNHDANDQATTPDAAVRIGDAEFLAMTKQASEQRAAGQQYCYRDRESKKIRYIFLDSGHPNSAVMDQVQVDWLKERILELESGWTVLVFVHQFFNGALLTQENLTLDGNGKKIIAALDEIYDESEATVAGVLSGHCHRDGSYRSEKGWIAIATTCDAYGRATRSGRGDIENPVRTLGTVYEQAFDVVTLDTDARMLYLTRIGAGRDREFSY